jgi:hypothetical protein
MFVAWKFWLSEICRSYVCQTSGMMATMWKVLGYVTSGRTNKFLKNIKFVACESAESCDQE